MDKIEVLFFGVIFSTICIINATVDTEEAL